MKTAILTVGVMFSGKSTFADNLIKNDSSFVEISRDYFRNTLFPKNHKFTSDDEAIVTSSQYDMIRDCSENNDNIIITNSNLRMNHIRRFISILEFYGYDVKIKMFDGNIQSISEKITDVGIDIRRNDLEQQCELYEIIKDKLVSNSRYNKYIIG